MGFGETRISGVKCESFQHTLPAVLALSDVLGSFSFMVSTPWFLRSDPRLVSGVNRTGASEDQEPLSDITFSYFDGTGPVTGECVKDGRGMVAVKRLKIAKKLLAMNKKNEFYDEILKTLCMQ